MNVLILFWFIATSNVLAIHLTPEQSEKIDNLAWLYAQFTMTFDKNELPLIDSFKRNEFEKFKEVLHFFNDENLQQYVSGVNMNEFAVEFERISNDYKLEIFIADLNPLTFKSFYVLFEKFLDAGLETHWDKAEFCSNIEHSTEEIATALKNFDIQNPFPKTSTSSLKKYEEKYHILSKKFKSDIEGVNNPKPPNFSWHHMIPSETIIAFYRAYVELFKFKSEKSMIDTKNRPAKNIDWFKIIEFNTQKAFLIESQTIYNFFPEVQPPFDKVRTPISSSENDVVNQQVDFIRGWYRWPRGLLFYGPSSQIRGDDLGAKFEINLKYIVGEKYAQKVEQLYDDLTKFNTDYLTSTSDEAKEDISNTAMNLYKRLGTIYKDYNNGKPLIVIPYNYKQWESSEVSTKKGKQIKWSIRTDGPASGIIYDTELQKWIDMNDKSDDGPSIETWKRQLEWREKQLAQEQDDQTRLNYDFISTNLAVLGVIYSMQKYRYDHDELKRRKRHHYKPALTIDELLKMCEKVKAPSLSKPDPCDYYFENGSPSILAVPAWGWCKVFG
jgi:hypothetical protein